MNVVGEATISVNMPKPHARPRRIDIATPPPTPIAAIAIAACRNRKGDGFRYQAVGADQNWSGSVATSSRELAILEAMARIRDELAESDRVRFLVSIPATSLLWHHQHEIAGALPGASLEWPGVANLSLMEAAQSAVTDAVDEVVASPLDTSPLTVATDGSFRHNHIGSGWLAPNGQYGLTSCRYRRSIFGFEPVLVSELRAIVDAVGALPDRPLTLQSDSKSAIDMAANWMAGCDRLPNGYNRFDIKRNRTDLSIGQQMIHAERGRLTLMWVRGHQGEPLNEGADALARLARRHAADLNDLTPDEYQRRAAGLADAFACEYNRPGREEVHHDVC